MIGAIRVHGMDKVLSNLNAEMKKIQFKNKKGLIQAGLLVQRESQKITPRALSNLVASAFTVWGPGATTTSPSFKGKEGGRIGADHSKIVNQEKMKLPAGDINPTVEVGYSAYYAIYVHENMQAKHKKGKEPKFLQRALERNYGQILNIVRDNGKI